MAKPPSPSEPVYELRKVPVRECGEPLVDFTQACPRLFLAKPVFQYVRATLVRKTVAEMLDRASRLVPKGYRLGILEGWRPSCIQRRMWLTSWLRFKSLHPDWSDHQLKRTVNRFVAPPDASVPPPHSTGGAVDVFLVDETGGRIDHSSPYELYDPKSYSPYPPGLSDTARRHREILRAALEGAGLTNYPSEWWHWSYGDQGWAYRGGHPNAIYGRIEMPDGWTPNPEDDTEEPLLRLGRSDPSSGFPRVEGSLSP